MYKFLYVQDIYIRVTISLLLKQLEILRLLTSSPSDIFQRGVLGTWAPQWPAKWRNQEEVARIPKIYQEFCHHRPAQDFNIDQMAKHKERLFFKIFINTRPDIKAVISLTNLDIHSVGTFLQVWVDVYIQFVINGNMCPDGSQ